MSGQNRMRLQLTPTLKAKTQVRQRLLAGGSMLAVALLFGIGVFMYGNFGNSHEAFASTSNNMGFENGTSDWTSSAGSWSSDNTTSRSGTSSLKTLQQPLLQEIIITTLMQIHLQVAPIILQ